MERKIDANHRIVKTLYKYYERKTAQGYNAAPKPNTTTTYDFVITYIVRVRCSTNFTAIPGILRNKEMGKRKKS